jgi:hypothetical protein
MDVLELLKAHGAEIKERFAVKRIGVFGSHARGVLLQPESRASTSRSNSLWKKRRERKIDNLWVSVELLPIFKNKKDP